MSDSTLDSNIAAFDDDLTPTQEYVTAGIVIALFGLLYWFINHGWNAQSDLDFDSGLPQSSLGSADLSSSRPDGLADAKPVVATAATAVAASAVAPVAMSAKPDASVANAESATPATAVDTDIPIAPLSKMREVVDQQAQMVTPEQVTQDDAQNEASKMASAEDELKKIQAETLKAEEEAKKQASAVSKLEEKKPAQQEQAAATAKENIYKLPNGKEVKISSSGFENDFKIAIEKGEVNKPIRFDNIYFESGSATMKAKSDHQVKATAALLHKHKNIKILLRGHTDNTGLPANNVQLSMMRANAMGVALGQLGINLQRIRVTAMGDLYPVASNATEAGRKKNRRIEVLILE